jgi:predicted kinase
MCKGLPASGKDTFAREEMKTHPAIYKRVNKDDIRALLDFSVWSRDNEDFVLKVRDMLIKMAFDGAFSVICTDTNLASKHEARLQQLAKENNAEFEIKDFTDVPLLECLARDRVRPNKVGDKVIMGMYNQFLKKEPSRPLHDPKLPSCVWCDCDGTLALFGKENPYDRDFSKDFVNESVKGVLNRYSEYGAEIIIVSGRNGKYKKITEDWLKNNGIPYNSIFMREEGDSRKDFIIKKEIYEREIKGKYNVLFCLDDRNQVVDMLRNEGLSVFQVADGNF